MTDGTSIEQETLVLTFFGTGAGGTLISQEEAVEAGLEATGDFQERKLDINGNGETVASVETFTYEVYR